MYGTSDNSEVWWPRTGWDALGHRPADNAAHHPPTGPLTDRWTGGAFADQDLLT
ncbi:hypothetical protein [Streptomyces sp. sk226]|uniref:hypothetical protein n=1 Tax=Streptomyces sp. sk226 TaxID=2034268 RepID=UPI0015CF6036|nr:hypothetical protein [Streptomyces sp. sk226]